MSAKRRQETIANFSVPVAAKAFPGDELAPRSRRAARHIVVDRDDDFAKDDSDDDFVMDDNLYDSSPVRSKKPKKSKGKGKAKARSPSPFDDFDDDLEVGDNPRVLLLSLKAVRDHEA
jgi:SWI/SNF-related matrix-associated actin-dependent regulator of chromatin subfamily A3